MNVLKTKIETLKKVKSANSFKKYIDYIRYPNYRNLEQNTTIDFTFPITFFVGKNGGGKSSTLHSLYGCPQGKSLGDLWFSTELDPIEELRNNRNCFIYGYKDNDGEYEVLKQRSLRDGNPDYWETAKPLQRYSMDKSKRSSPISKEVVYIDFRSELSAFDKYLHFSAFNRSKKFLTKQDYLRNYTIKLKNIFENNEEIRLYNRIRNKKKINLTQKEVDIINLIVGKAYESIELVEHNLFKDWGTSIRIKSKELNYSEAFAGSGETAVIMLVHKIYMASEESLILLDEPETSLHSGAQKRLLHFILDSAINKKHQFVISTHSQYLIEHMPDEAIKVFSRSFNSERFSISNKCNYKEAFYELEIHNYDIKRGCMRKNCSRHSS